MCWPRAGFLPCNLVSPLFHRKSPLPTGWDHRMHQERSSGRLQSNLLLQVGLTWSGCKGHYQSSLTFLQRHRFYNFSSVLIFLVPHWNVLFPKLCPLPLPVHLQDKSVSAFSTPSRKKSTFVFLPPWMTTSSVLWVSLNPHLYFTFIFLIENGPHLPWKWNINMQRHCPRGEQGKFNKSP